MVLKLSLDICCLPGLSSCHHQLVCHQIETEHWTWQMIVRFYEEIQWLCGHFVTILLPIPLPFYERACVFLRKAFLPGQTIMQKLVQLNSSNFEALYPFEISVLFNFLSRVVRFVRFPRIYHFEISTFVGRVARLCILSLEIEGSSYATLTVSNLPNV